MMISIARTVAALIFIFPISLSAQERSSADSLSPRLLDSVEVHAYLMLTSFSDTNNTNINPTVATGVVPSYHVWDWSASWRFARYYHLSAGINNVANARYFTRRIDMYPGPGILPADGRSFYVSPGLKL